MKYLFASAAVYFAIASIAGDNLCGIIAAGFGFLAGYYDRKQVKP